MLLQHIALKVTTPEYWGIGVTCTTLQDIALTVKPLTVIYLEYSNKLLQFHYSSIRVLQVPVTEVYCKFIIQYSNLLLQLLVLLLLLL